MKNATKNATIRHLKAALRALPIALAALCGAPAAAQTTTPGSFAERLAAQAPGTWQRMNLNRFDDVWTRRDRLTVPNAPAVLGSQRSIILAWGSMAWDPNRDELVIFGGGHANYPGNDVYRWRASSRRWERASLPSAVREHTRSMYTAIDGIDAAPASAHTYDNSEYLPIADRFVSFGGAAYNTGAKWQDSTRSREIGPYYFDPSRAHPDRVGGTDGSHSQPGIFTNTYPGEMWENRDSLITGSTGPGHPGAVWSGFINGSSAYREEGGIDVLYINDIHLWRYAVPDPGDRSQDTFEKVGNYSTPTTGQGAGAIDVDRDLYVRIRGGYRGNGRSIRFWDLDTPGPSNPNQRVNWVDNSGTFDEDAMIHLGMDYDPVRRHFVMWGGGERLWSLTPPAGNPSTGTWTIDTLASASAESPPVAGTDILGKWKYVVAHDVFVGINNAYSGDIWVFKPDNWRPTASAAEDRQAPDVTITSPTAYSLPVDGEVTVLVDASDDTGVAEVRLYAAGELVDSDAAAPYRLTFDAGLFNEGFATLRAEAEDFAGNTRFSDGVRLQVVARLPDEIVVDELDSNTSRSGFWPTGYRSVPYAGTSRRGDTSSRFSWFPQVPVAGAYDVYAWWTPASTRGASVPYTITHSGGDAVVRVDQSDLSTRMQWNFLGSYNFTAGSATITLRGAGAGGEVSADAVRLVPTGGPLPPNAPPVARLTASATAGEAPLPVNFNAAGSSDPDGDDLSYAWAFGDGATATGATVSHSYATAGSYTARVTVRDPRGASSSATASITVTSPGGEIIVDNRDSNTSSTGAWPLSSGANPFASDSWYSNSAGTFQWRPALPAAGSYEVYVRWTYHPNRSTTVPYRVTHDGGVSTTVVNQRLQSTASRWTLLGTYAMTPGANGVVSVSSESGQASADAVRLLPADGQPPSTDVEVIVDNTSPAVTRTGNWPLSSGVNPYGSNSWYSNSGSTLTWRPALPQAGRYKVYARWTWHQNRTGQVPYDIATDDGVITVEVDQRVRANASSWQLLGSYPMTPGSSGTVTISSRNGQASADAVRLVLE